MKGGFYPHCHSGIAWPGELWGKEARVSLSQQPLTKWPLSPDLSTYQLTTVSSGWGEKGKEGSLRCKGSPTACWLGSCGGVVSHICVAWGHPPTSCSSQCSKNPEQPHTACFWLQLPGGKKVNRAPLPQGLPPQLSGFVCRGGRSGQICVAEGLCSLPPLLE